MLQRMGTFQNMSHKTLLLIDMLAIAVSPFATWGLLVIIGRGWKTNLRGTLPWLRVLRWVTWVVALLVFFIALTDERLWLGGFASAVVCASSGLGFVEQWVKQRYAPELLPSNSPTTIL